MLEVWERDERQKEAEILFEEIMAKTSLTFPNHGWMEADIHVQ